jgi:hypothetical protein
MYIIYILHSGNADINCCNRARYCCTIYDHQWPFSSSSSSFSTSSCSSKKPVFSRSSTHGLLPFFYTHLFFGITKPSYTIFDFVGIASPTRSQASRCENTFAIATANFLFNYTVQLRCFQRAPGRRVTENSQLFHTNRRSGRDRGSNPGHMRGRQR